ncbi:MAG: hemolysin III family protein [Anaerolineae bacterium]|nr:hemolysin III family protein [Anaerolineae bacterium]
MNHFREPVSGFLHLGGAILAGIGSIGLVGASWQTPDKMASLLVYGVSMVLLYSASAALHLTNGSARTILWLKRCDHAAIYVLIAGTYTPFCYNLLDGAWRWGMLLLVWGVAIAGVGYKLLCLHQAGHRSTLLYVAMGWVGLVGAPKFLPVLPTGALVLLLAGGLVYSAGAVVFALQRPNLHRWWGYHEIWHIFVLGGSALQFAAVVRYVV